MDNCQLSVKAVQKVPAVSVRQPAETETATAKPCLLPFI